MRTKITLGKPDAQTEMVKLSECDYAWPGFYNGAHGHGLANFEEHRRGLQTCLHLLAQRLAKAVYPKNMGPEGSYEAEPLFVRPDYDYPLGDAMGEWFNIVALFERSDIDLFRALYDHIAQFSQLCYLSGFKGGQNVLTGLASGTLNLEALAETNIRLAEHVQKSNDRKPYKRAPKKPEPKKPEPKRGKR